MKALIALVLTLLLLTGVQAQSDQSKKSKKAASQTSSQQTAKADINASSQSELEAVKGIGPATAKKIIANRPYSSLDDLKKAGLTQARIDKMRDSLTVSASRSAGSSNSSSPSTTSKKPSLWERLKGKKSSDSAQSTSTSAPSQNAATSSPTPNTTQAPGGGSGKVWVNKNTKVFHREGR